MGSNLLLSSRREGRRDDPMFYLLNVLFGFLTCSPTDGSSTIFDPGFHLRVLLGDACFRIIHLHNFAVMRSFSPSHTGT